MSSIRLHKIISLYVLFSLTFLSVQARDFYTINTKDGLPSSNIWSLHQDSLGYMWMGTTNGLVRYDGSEFKIFSQNDGLLGNSIVSVCEASNGNILVASYQKGINEIRLEDSLSIINSAPFQTNVHTLEYKGYYYSTKKYQFEALEKKSNKVVEWQREDYLAENKNSKYLLEYNDTLLSASSSSGLIYIDSLEMKPFILSGNDTLQSQLYSLFIDNKNNLICGGVNELYIINSERKIRKIELNYEKDRSINSLVRDEDGNFWLTIDGEGLFRLSLDSQYQITELKKINDVHVNDILVDRDDNIWVATFGQGLFVYTKNLFKNYKFGKDFTFKNAHNLWFDYSHERIFLGGVDGLGFIEKGEISELPFEKDKRGLHLISNITGTADGTLLALVSNKTGPDYSSFIQKKIDIKSGFLVLSDNRSKKNILINRNLIDPDQILVYNVFEKEDGVFKKSFDFRRKRIIYPSTTWPIIADNNYIYAVLNKKIICRFNSKKGESINLDSLILATDADCNSFDVSDKEIGNLIKLYTHKDAFILGMDSGIYSLDFCTQKLNLIHSLEGSSYSDFELLNDNRVAVATKDGLLVIADGERSYFTEKLGLLGRDVLDLELDTVNNNLWAVTYAGLTRINLTRLDSVIDNNSRETSIASIRSSHGYISPLDDIELDYSDNSIVFELADVDYTLAGTNEYEYILSHDDEKKDKWSKETDKELNFPDLSPGDYLLQVKVKDSNYIVSKKFRVNFPWWRSTIFYILLSLSLLSIGYYIWKLRESTLLRRKQAALDFERRINDLEQQALGAMMNPHFIFNSLNSVQYYINKNQSKLANDYLAKISNLIRLNLELAGEKDITLSQELQRLNLYLELEKLRLGDKLSYHISVAEDVDIEELFIPSMIIQPIVENSIWHGITPKEGDGRVDIRIHTADDRVQIEIQDDGVGLKSSKRAEWKSSRGRQLTEERINLFARSHNSYSIFEMINLADSAEHSSIGVLTKLNLPDVGDSDLY